MSDGTAIEWTDATWNPVRGCTKVSAGCKFCYAETFAERWRGVPGHAFEQGFDLKLVPGALSKPLRWKEPRRIFVNSMSDLFHDGVPDEYIAAVFGVMAASPRHTFQVLTKRPERALRWFQKMVHNGNTPAERCVFAANDHPEISQYPEEIDWRLDPGMSAAWPLPNVWIGVSVEDQRAADERIPLLLQIPAAVRFLSCEPLIGPVDLKPWIRWVFREGVQPNADGTPFALPAVGGGRGLDWVIAGGESGPKARPCHRSWLQRIVFDCADAEVACFIKQAGAYVVDRNDAGWSGDEPHSWPNGTEYVDDEEHTQGWQGERVRVRLRSRKGADPAEWPETLRVREFPGAALQAAGSVLRG